MATPQSTMQASGQAPTVASASVASTASVSTSATSVAAGPLAVGSKVPDFILKFATADGVKEWTLSQNLGKGPVVFAFFPIAFSGVCTKEMCDMRDNLGQFTGLGAQVVGFSTDTQHGNTEFVRMHKMNHGILSDPNRDIIPRIWTMGTVAGIRNVAKRGVMVVGSDGTVKWTSVSDDPTVWVGAEEVRKHL